jgi:uncharacterized membrane protein
MQKRTFWPLVALVFGLIIVATNLGMLPTAFLNLWPMILIVVGLGGLLTSDRDEWLSGQGASKSKKATRKR